MGIHWNFTTVAVAAYGAEEKKKQIERIRSKREITHNLMKADCFHFLLMGKVDVKTAL